MFVKTNSIMRKISFIIVIIIFLANNKSFAQFSKFQSHFNKVTLPFITKANSFDVWASEDPYLISEDEFKTFLLYQGDSFLVVKNSLKLKKSGYSDYFSVGKFTLNDNFICLLYYRTFMTNENQFLFELMITVFDQKGNLISSLPISGLNTKNNEVFYCNIEKDKTIIIKYFIFPDEEFKYQKNYSISSNGYIVEK